MHYFENRWYDLLMLHWLILHPSFRQLPILFFDAQEKLVATVIALANDNHTQQMLSKNSKALAIKNADVLIANQILNSIKWLK